MIKKSFFTLVLPALLFFFGQITAGISSEFKPSIIYDLSGKFDKSFGESAYNGIEKFKKDFGIDYLEFELTKESQRKQIVERLAQRSDLIILVGYGFMSLAQELPKDFPNKKFVTIDYFVDLPNVQSLLFNEHEGCFLVGMLAAMNSETNKIGFVGGMDMPAIRRFAVGYEEGAKYISPDITLYSNMIGSTADAWNNPLKALELAKSQIDRGADVVFSAAGESSLGVLQAAAEENVKAIGIDSNQNYIYPGKILTSMVKNVNLAIYNVLKETADHKFKAGKRILGLKENGVGYSLDKHNAPLLTGNMIKRVEKAKSDIISGKLKVTDHLKSN